MSEWQALSRIEEALDQALGRYIVLESAQGIARAARLISSYRAAARR